MSFKAKKYLFKLVKKWISYGIMKILVIIRRFLLINRRFMLTNHSINGLVWFEPGLNRVWSSLRLKVSQVAVIGLERFGLGLEPPNQKPNHLVQARNQPNQMVWNQFGLVQTWFGLVWDQTSPTLNSKQNRAVTTYRRWQRTGQIVRIMTIRQISP